jgi:hypothetical protein
MSAIRLAQISQDLSEFRHRFPRAKLSFAHARKIDFVSQKSLGAVSQRFGFAGLRRRTPGPPPFPSMNSTRQGGSKRLFLNARNWVRFAKNDRFSSFLLWRLPKSNARSAPVFLGELHTGGL